MLFFFIILFILTYINIKFFIYNVEFYISISISVYFFFNYTSIYKYVEKNIYFKVNKLYVYFYCLLIYNLLFINKIINKTNENKILKKIKNNTIKDVRKEIINYYNLLLSIIKEYSNLLLINFYVRVIDNLSIVKIKEYELNEINNINFLELILNEDIYRYNEKEEKILKIFLEKYKYMDISITEEEEQEQKFYDEYRYRHENIVLNF